MDFRPSYMINIHSRQQYEEEKYEWKYEAACIRVGALRPTKYEEEKANEAKAEAVEIENVKILKEDKKKPKWVWVGLDLTEENWQFINQVEEEEEEEERWVSPLNNSWFSCTTQYDINLSPPGFFWCRHYYS